MALQDGKELEKNWQKASKEAVDLFLQTIDSQFAIYNNVNDPKRIIRLHLFYFRELARSFLDDPKSLCPLHQYDAKQIRKIFETNNISDIQKELSNISTQVMSFLEKFLIWQDYQKRFLGSLDETFLLSLKNAAASLIKLQEDLITSQETLKKNIEQCSIQPPMAPVQKMNYLVAAAPDKLNVSQKKMSVAGKTVIFLFVLMLSAAIALTVFGVTSPLWPVWVTGVALFGLLVGTLIASGLVSHFLDQAKAKQAALMDAKQPSTKIDQTEQYTLNEHM